MKSGGEGAMVEGLALAINFECASTIPIFEGLVCERALTSLMSARGTH